MEENAVVAHQESKIINFEEYAMTSDNLVHQVALIQDVMCKIMKSGEHYGTIPGCGTKPTLLKPGAEKLSTVFRLAPYYDIKRADLPNGHREYEILCTLKHIPTGQVVSQGVGSCSTMEGKYRYRNEAKKCPECGKEAIIKGKAEYGGGWLCFKKKDGCGAKWSDGDAVIEEQISGKVEHDNPADYYNTVLKMGKKRAHVDAVLTATAASDIFTQDIEDMTEIIKGAMPQEKPKDGPRGNEPEGRTQGTTPERLQQWQGDEIIKVALQDPGIIETEVRQIIDWYCEKNGRTFKSGEYMLKNWGDVFQSFIDGMEKSKIIG